MVFVENTDPPRFLRLVAHPVRWRLLRELVHSDRAVWELTQLLGERQSLVSYHLGQLRTGGLVRARRSSADGRDSYYAVDLASCGEQLQRAGGALHPALWLVPRPPTPPSHRALPSPTPGLVPVHREQRTLADRGGAARADVGGSGRSRVGG